MGIKGRAFVEKDNWGTGKQTCRWVYRMVAGDTMLFKGNNSHVGGFEVKACIMSSEAHGRYDW